MKKLRGLRFDMLLAKSLNYRYSYLNQSAIGGEQRLDKGLTRTQRERENKPVNPRGRLHVKQDVAD